MAHIRQILANLSISVSEFKKNPKTVVKAVKSEPIAVIINDKPAFYCVPADILESLYSKFYEMNEIQNIQELNNDSDDPVCTGDDDSFGVHDIFQTIEDEQAAKMASSDDLVDPIKNSVADPLDEEVANKLNCSIDNHLLESNNKVASLNAPNAMDLSFNDLGEQDNISGFDEFNEIDPIRDDGFNDNLLGNFDNSDKVNDDLNYVSSLTDMDDLRSPGIKSKDESHSEATLAHAEKVVKQEQEKAKDTKASDTIPTDMDDLRSPGIKSKDESHSEATLAHAEKVVKQEQEKAKDTKASDTIPTDQVPCNQVPSDAKVSKASKAKLATTTDNKSTKDSGAKKSTKDGEQAKDLAQPKKELNIVQGTDHKISATSTNASASTSASANASASANPSSKSASSKASTTKSDETKLNIDAGSQIQSNKDNSQSSNQVCEVLSDVNANNNQSMRNLVSGPHSFSLEHVAKTYSPYKQKKLLEKRQQELKKEQKAEHKAKQKELKKLEKAAKYLKLDPKSVQEAEKKKAKEQHSKDAKKSKKSKFVKLKPDDVKNV